MVGDRSGARARLVRELRDRGWDPVLAGTLGEVRRYTTREGVPPFVITEQLFRRGSALELIADLRAARRDVRIVVLTRYPAMSGAERTIVAGADAYLAAPGTTDEVVAALSSRGRRGAPIWSPEEEELSLAQHAWEIIIATALDLGGDIHGTAERLRVDYSGLRRKLAAGRPD